MVRMDGAGGGVAGGDGGGDDRRHLARPRPGALGSMLNVALRS